MPLAANRSNGPDCTGGTSCCCDVCTQNHIGCEGTDKCCKCVPNILCAVFTPDDPECLIFSSLLEGDGGDLVGALTVEFGGQPQQIRVYLDGYVDNCHWRVFSEGLGIDETYTIDGEYVTCRDFMFEIPLEPVSGCPGTLTITPYLLEKVPFVRHPSAGEPSEEEFSCGYCDTVCKAICVKYPIGDTTYWVQFAWNAEYGYYEHDGDTIELNEIDGVCYATISIADLFDAGITFDPVELTECGRTLFFRAEDYDGNWLEASCNLCSCWDYLCGTCRCACPTLCVVTADANEEPVYYELDWDSENDRWGDDYFSIGLGRDPNDDTKCALFIDGYDPISIYDCGKALEFGATVEDEDGHILSQVSGRCKECRCFIPANNCYGVELEEMPLFLVATFENFEGCSCIDYEEHRVYLLYRPIDSTYIGEGIISSICKVDPDGNVIGDTWVQISIPCHSLESGGVLSVPGGSLGCTAEPGYTCFPVHMVFGGEGTNPECTIAFDRSDCANEPQGAGLLVMTLTE